MEPFSYPSEDIAVVINRHTHDVRNALNGMEIELTLLGEGAATDPAMRDAVRRLRAAGAEMSRLMQGLSSKYAMQSPGVIPAIQIVERWQADSRHVASDAPLSWSMQLGDGTVWVEAGLIRTLLKDALEMAHRISGKRPLQINGRCEGGRIVFEIAGEDGGASTGLIDSQQAYWAALRGLAERGQILMRPEILSPHDCFPMQLSMPLHQPVT